MKSLASQDSGLCNGGLDRSFTVAEFFAGIGLFRMGLERAGWQVAYANDWSTERAQMYSGFFGDGYDVKDVFDVFPSEIPEVTLATCSFPCIDLSLAGNLRGLGGKHSSAFWGFHHLLNAQGSASPPLVLLENVGGWLSANEGRDFYAVASSLNDIGYLCDAFTLDARSFVPQSRPRVFLIGLKEDAFPDIDCHVAPSVYNRSKRLLPSRLKKLLAGNHNIKWAKLDIPEPPSYKSSGFTEEIAECLSDDDDRWWSSEKVEKHLAMMSPSHSAIVKDLATQQEEAMRTFYRRCRAAGQRAEVRSEDIAGCLRTAVGGSGKQFLVSAGKGNVRMRTLTPREYARLQGVPDSFPIVADTERQALTAFGDAVCVPVVTWTANNILSPLARMLEPDVNEISLASGKEVIQGRESYGRQCNAGSPQSNNGAGKIQGHEAGNAGASPVTRAGLQIPLA